MSMQLIGYYVPVASCDRRNIIRIIAIGNCCLVIILQYKKVTKQYFYNDTLKVPD